MAEPTIPELQRKSQFIAGTIGANRHALTLLKQEFAKSAEGQEAGLLESALKYVVNFDTFLEHFISGPPGSRTVDGLIARLERPATGKPDDKTVKKLKGMVADFEKQGLPDLAAWHTLFEIKENARNIKTDDDPRNFRENLNKIISTANSLPEKLHGTFDSSIKSNRNLSALNDYEKALTLWRIILHRLAIPADKLSENTGIPKDIHNTVTKWLDEGGLPDPENKDNSNWSSFPVKIKAEKGNNMLVKALGGFGQKEYATKILLWNLNGKMTRDEYVNAINEHIAKLRSHSEISSIELEAGKAVSGIAHSILENSKKQIEASRKKFEEVISGRAKEITGEHAKALEATVDIARNTESHVKRAAMTSDLCADDYERIMQSEADEKNALARALDILRIMKARIIFRQFESKVIDAPQMNKEISAILSANPQRFVIDIINLLSSRATMRLNNQITVLEYDGEMRNIDSKIHEFVGQIPVVCRVLNLKAEEIEALSSEYEAMMASAVTDIDRANRIAMEGDRMIRKLSHIERYREQLPPEEWEVYREAA